MPPLHPILVHFPLALFTVALGADVIGRVRPTAEASALGFWCLVVAVLGAAGAVAAGFLDMYRADLAEATHRFVHLHRDSGLVLFAALVLLAVWRWWIWRRTAPSGGVGWPYLLSAGAVFALVLFQGWFGGELVYGLGAGVSAAGQGVVSPEEGQMGLAPLSVFTEEVHGHHGHHPQ
jgi:uncharacterized membrane protein